jgi:hypothetical protein
MYIRVDYTDHLKQKHLISTGEELLPEEREWEFPDLTAELRQAAIGLDMTGWFGNGFKHYSLPEIKDDPGRFWQPSIQEESIKFGRVPSDDELFAVVLKSWKQKQECNTRIGDLKEQWDRISKERAAKTLAAREAHQRHIEEKKAQYRLDAITIKWKPDGTALFDLVDGLMVASDLDVDDRYNSWVKEVSAIDRLHKDGWMYQGEMLDEGTQEITNTERRVFICSASCGSRKYNTRHYQVVELVGGELIKHDELHTDDDKRGWALRLRDGIATLLDNKPEPVISWVLTDDLAERVMNLITSVDPDLAEELDNNTKIG